MNNYGKLTSLVWLNGVSCWLHIEDGKPLAAYNNLYDFVNRIVISNDSVWEDKWKLVIEELNNQFSTICGEINA